MQNKDELAIRKVVDDWLQATREGRADDVLPLMEPDALFLVPGQPPLRGRDAFAQGLRTLLATHTIEALGDVEEIALSGDLACIRTHLKIEVTPKDANAGPPMRRSGYTMSLLRRQPDGRWLLARDANLLANV